MPIMLKIESLTFQLISEVHWKFQENQLINKRIAYVIKNSNIAKLRSPYISGTAWPISKFSQLVGIVI